jgi:hypothetical protein
MQYQCYQRVVVFFRSTHKRADTHTNDEHGEIAHDDGKGMTYEKIHASFAFRHAQKLFFGSYGVRANACAEQF